jgi:hypothetical protein
MYLNDELQNKTMRDMTSLLEGRQSIYFISLIPYNSGYLKIDVKVAEIILYPDRSHTLPYIFFISLNIHKFVQVLP